MCWGTPPSKVVLSDALQMMQTKEITNEKLVLGCREEFSLLNLAHNKVKQVQNNRISLSSSVDA